MNTKFSWILVALLVSSFVCWSSTFAPGQHNPKMRYGKRHFVPQSNRANVSWLIAMHVESFLQGLFFTFKIIFFPQIYMERSALFSFFFFLACFQFPYLFALQEYLPRAWLKKSVEDTAKKQLKARLEWGTSSGGVQQSVIEFKKLGEWFRSYIFLLELF